MPRDVELLPLRIHLVLRDDNTTGWVVITDVPRDSDMRLRRAGPNLQNALDKIETAAIAAKAARP
jgi:hypothetical protein